MDRPVCATSRPQPLLVPAGRGDLQAHHPDDGSAEDRAIGDGQPRDHVGDAATLQVRGVRERHQGGLAGEAVDLLDRVAHRIHIGGAGAQLLVHGDPAALADPQASRRGQRGVRPHADRGDHEIGGKR